MAGDQIFDREEDIRRYVREFYSKLFTEEQRSRPDIVDDLLP